MEEIQLIFVISQPRSGSTLLQSVLSNNSLVSTSSEPWILLPFLNFINGKENGSIYNDILSKKAIEEFNEKKLDNELYEKISQFLLTLYNSAVDKGSSYFLDKTPRYYEILSPILKVFPNCKIILLKRNPIDVLASIINTWNVKSIEELLFYKRDILFAPFEIQRFADKSKNIRVTHYESIVNQSEEEIQSLYNWLNIPFVEEVLSYKGNSKVNGFMGDKNLYKHSKPLKKQEDKNEIFYLSNKYWKSFFEGYANYLGSEFMESYGYEFKNVQPRKSKMFDMFLLNSSNSNITKYNKLYSFASFFNKKIDNDIYKNE
ncbi:sulfotransferase family protein [Chondrinema litorale]|uniref:sulfotransferase family protein n=1 Tax=Chondrinema litorale TaxID=2994555 RepID=UPI00254317BF|nr:sulfotransferase [Chondrinema litorale]UZR92534.1 sulfotransferase [Chondrinema litorale]